MQHTFMHLTEMRFESLVNLSIIIETIVIVRRTILHLNFNIWFIYFQSNFNLYFRSCNLHSENPSLVCTVGCPANM